MTGTRFEVLDQVEYPHSTGIAYTATTQFIGFPHYGDEGKVMGLAPYGKPRYIDVFRDMIRTRRWQTRLHVEPRLFPASLRRRRDVVGRRLAADRPHLLGQIHRDFWRTARCRVEPLTAREEDIAASLQLRLEEVGFHILNQLHAHTGLTDLCSGRRSRAQFRDERQNPAQHAVSPRIRPAGRRRQRHCPRRLLLHLQSDS